jgi:hypothetical protein
LSDDRKSFAIQFRFNTTIRYAEVIARPTEFSLHDCIPGNDPFQEGIGLPVEPQSCFVPCMFG